MRILIISLIINLWSQWGFGAASLEGGAAAAAQEASVSAPECEEEDPESTRILNELFQTVVDFKLETNFLSPLKRQLGQKRQQLQQAYITYYQTSERTLVTSGDSGDPCVFDFINEKAQEAIGVIQIQKKRDFISSHRRAVDFSVLSSQEFDQLYLECFSEKQLMENVSKQFESLIEFSKKEFAVRVLRLDDAMFAISVDSPVIGYSVFDLLKTAEIIEEGAVFDLDVCYPLDKSALIKLNEWFKDLHLWIQDFTEVCSTLVGENCIELGQKSVAEFRKSTPLTEQSLAYFSSLEQKIPVLLFNTVSINIEEHPYRDPIKGLFEGIYRFEELRARDGRPKAFLTGTYRSNIGIPQLIKICPHLNKVAMAKKCAEGMLGEHGFFNGAAQSFGMNTLDFMKQFKAAGLNEIAQTTMKGRYHRGVFPSIGGRLNPLREVAEVEGKSLEICEEYLQRETGIRFKEKSQRLTISRQQIRELYQGAEKCDYTGGVRHQNIPLLFAALKTSTSFQEALVSMPGLEDSVDQLSAEVVAKLHSYHTLPEASIYFGKALVDEGIRYLETYVAKIIYKEQSGVTQESIDGSFNKIAAIIGPDLVNGCARGFAGRLNDLLLSLVASAGSDIEASFEELKMRIYQEALESVRGGGESSMTMLNTSKELSKVLSIDGSSPLGWVVPSTFDTIPTVTTRRVLKYFSNEFTPVNVYHHLRQMIGNKFWQLNNEDDDEGMYKLLLDLKMGSSKEEIDAKYRVNQDASGPWQYAFFQQDLPGHLIQALFDLGILFTKERAVVETVYETPLGSPFVCVGYVPPVVAAYAGGGGAAAGGATAAGSEFQQASGKKAKSKVAQKAKPGTYG